MSEKKKRESRRRFFILDLSKVAEAQSFGDLVHEDLGAMTRASDAMERLKASFSQLETADAGNEFGPLALVQLVGVMSGEAMVTFHRTFSEGADVEF